MSQNTLNLVVASPTCSRDSEKGIVRIDHDSMEIIDALSEDVIEIKGKRRTVARCLPLYPSDEGKEIIRIGGFERNNSGIAIGDVVAIKKLERSKIHDAQIVVLSPLQPITPTILENKKYFASTLDQLPIIMGNNLLVPYFGQYLVFQVIGINKKADASIITKKTIFHIAEPEEPYNPPPRDGLFIDILKSRLAKGEMTIEEYNRIKRSVF